MPRRRAKLNTRQLEVLKWIADGCPDGVMEDFTYKTTAVALQSRGLVTVRRTKDGWTALITPAGEHYLGHGDYPPRPPDLARVRSVDAAGLVAADATVRAMRRAAVTQQRPVKTHPATRQEMSMRYRVMVTRVQVAERYVRATDEEDAAAKVQAEFDRPYGYFGSWRTTASEVEVIEAEQTVAVTPASLSSGGPLLLSLKDAARSLGISYSTLYELTNRGDIEHTRIGSRKYIARETLLRFIDNNTHRGYHG